MLMPPPQRTRAAAVSCTLLFATFPSLNHLENTSRGHNHNLSKTNAHTYVKQILEVLLWNLLVCRGTNKHTYMFSVLKSAGCIATYSFCMGKHVCACIQLCEWMGILNLQHPVHIIGSLKFKRCLEESFGGQCVLPPIQNGCVLPPPDQVSYDFFSSSPGNPRSQVPLSSLALLPFLWRCFSWSLVLTCICCLWYFQAK